MNNYQKYKDMIKANREARLGRPTRVKMTAEERKLKKIEYYNASRAKKGLPPRKKKRTAEEKLEHKRFLARQLYAKQKAARELEFGVKPKKPAMTIEEKRAYAREYRKQNISRCREYANKHYHNVIKQDKELMAKRAALTNKHYYEKNKRVTKAEWYKEYRKKDKWKNYIKSYFNRPEVKQRHSDYIRAKYKTDHEFRAMKLAYAKQYYKQKKLNGNVHS